MRGSGVQGGISGTASVAEVGGRVAAPAREVYSVEGDIGQFVGWVARQQLCRSVERARAAVPVTVTGGQPGPQDPGRGCIGVAPGTREQVHRVAGRSGVQEYECLSPAAYDSCGVESSYAAADQECS